MNIRAIAFTEKGQGWQEKLGFPVTRGVPVMQWAREAFADADALLFIGACGIAVRAIAPLCRDKAADPAVLVMDEMGRHIIPILSGAHRAAQTTSRCCWRNGRARSPC